MITESNYIITPVTNFRARDDAIKQISDKRRIRHMRFPTLKFRHDLDSFQETENSNKVFKKWNDEGEFHANAPCRAYDNIIDPTSGFVSAGGDIDRNTGHTMIRSLVQNNTTPQSRIPKCQNTVRKDATAPSELRLEETWSTGAPTLWNSNKTLDVVLRSKLGGWTSDGSTVKATEKSRRPQTAPVDRQIQHNRDKLALKYQYGTSTQRAYEEVPWDSILPPKLWPPISTMESKPDTVAQCCQNNRYASSAQEWQAVGKGLESFLPRNGNYKDGTIEFCTPYPRIQHIPHYSGCVGAENLDEIDNPKIEFKPYSVKRNLIPRPTETSHCPNIPLYTGCTLWQGYYAPAHSQEVNSQYVQPSGNRFELLQSPELEHKRKAEFSKMVTLVPPGNPFNNIDRTQIIM